MDVGLSDVKDGCIVLGKNFCNRSRQSRTVFTCYADQDKFCT